MRRAADGFTLIELLVAFAILSVTLVALLGAFESGLAQERRAGLAAQRVLEARSLIDAAGAAPGLAEGERDGVLATGEAWRLTIRRLAPPGGAGPDPMPAYRLDLTVTDGGRPTLGLSTVRLGG